MNNATVLDLNHGVIWPYLCLQYFRFHVVPNEFIVIFVLNELEVF